MKILNSIEELRAKLKGGGSVGLVPTMGAIHKGHLSLVNQARKDNDTVVVSVFVNPTQFAPGEDFEEYPRTLEADAEALEAAGCDFLFAPSADEMYPDLSTLAKLATKPGAKPAFIQTKVVPGKIAHKFEGAVRPTHFAGVATVVSKLFNIVTPTRAYFGEKDYQQLLVIKEMVKDLNMNVEVVACPTCRDERGLALSSRNQYLSKEERSQASAIFSAMQKAARAFEAGQRNADSLRHTIKDFLIQTLGKDELKINYIALVDAANLEEIEEASANPLETRILISLEWRGVHLIDNANLEIS